MEDFQGSETTLRDTVTVHICHYTFVQTQSAQHQEWNLNQSMDLGDNDMLCKFIDCSKCTLWLEMLIVAEAVHLLGGQGKREVSVPSAQFCSEPKGAL